MFAGTLPTTMYLWFNTTVAPFDNVKVRQAVNYAIDREAVLRIWGGPSQGVITDQILPPTMAGWKQVSTLPAGWRHREGEEPPGRSPACHCRSTP